MKILVLGPIQVAKNLLIFGFWFFCHFFCNIGLSKFPIKLPNDPSCTIYVFYKDKLQKKSFSLAKRKFTSL